MSLIPYFSWKMSEDYSVFDYEGDDGNAIKNKTRRPQIRAFSRGLAEKFGDFLMRD